MLRVALKYHGHGDVPPIGRNCHADIAKETQRAIDGLITAGDHAAFARGQRLSAMKGEAGNVTVRRANPLPLPVNLYFAAGRTGCILNHEELVAARDGKKSCEIARHPGLMNDQQRA